MRVNNSIVWGNSNGSFAGAVAFLFSDVFGGAAGTGNINADPAFVDAAGGDFSLGAGSPCVDRGDASLLPGDVETDIAGSARVSNAALDMGAFERQCPADYNQDGGIDGGDIEAFFADWESGLARSDVNADGGIDGADVDTFFAAWENGGC